MKIVSYNVNGIRAAMRKGFLEWLAQTNYDIVCLQEVKASQHEIDTSAIESLGYHIAWFAATKKGYSGVAVFSKQPFQNVIKGNGFTQSDYEGRVLQIEYPHYLLINTYFPAGISGEERQAYKYQFLEEYLVFLKRKQNDFANIIVVGDYNICHKAIDIHDPIGNKNASGFLPEEREWMDRFFEMGFVDSFRQTNPHPQQYSWWSWRANARTNNKGWRIDYVNVSTSLKQAIVDNEIFSNVRFSDHAPVYLDINL